MDFQSKANVFPDRHVTEKRVVLENKTNATLAGSKFIHPLSGNEDVAAVRCLKTGNHPKDCGFSAAGGSQKPDEPPPFHTEIHLIRCLEIPVMLVDIFQFHFIGHACHLFLPADGHGCPSAGAGAGCADFASADGHGCPSAGAGAGCADFASAIPPYS